MLNIILISLGLFILLVVSRLLQIYLNYHDVRAVYDGDSSYHLLRIKMCKKKLNDRRLVRFLYDKRISYYPILYHQLCALLIPLRWIKNYNWIPNLFIFLLGSSLFFFVSTYSIRSLDVDLSHFLIALGMFYIFSVGNLVHIQCALNYLRLSERLFARFLTGFYVLGLYLSFVDGVGYAYISIFCGVLIFFSSQFGRQAIIFFSLLSSILLMSFWPLAICIASLLISLILYPKYIVYGIREWCSHMRTYLLIMNGSKCNQGSLSKWVDIKELVMSFKKNVVLGVYYITTREPLMSARVSLDSIFLISILSLGYNNVGLDLTMVLIFISIPYLISFITSIGSLKIIGESYRYIEYLLYLLAPYLCAIYTLHYLETISHYILIYSLIMMALMCVYIFVYIPYRKKCETMYDSLGLLIEKYTVSEKDVVLTPQTQYMRSLSTLTNCKIVWFSSVFTYDAALNFYEKDRYPWLKREFQDLVTDYNVNLIIVHKKSMKAIDFTYDFSPYQKDYEDDHYIIFKVV